jgi:hypothetical protein
VKAAWVRAERDSEVRQAAGAWREARFIDDAALASIEEIYSAVWPRPGKTWGVLLFFFISCFVVGLLFSLGTAHALGLTAFLLAGGLAFAADRLRQSASTVGAAAGGAAAFWSVVCLLIGTGEAVHWNASTGTLVLFAGSLAWAAAAWRWGYPAFATFAALFFFLLLARFPPGRALWAILGAALAAACVPLLDRPALAPSHRRGAATVLAVSLAAVYAAINLYSFDHGLIEMISEGAWSTAPIHAGAGRTLSAIATGVFPLFVFGWGIRTRRTLLLDAGIVGAALSLVTLRFYVHIAPLWTILSVAGSGLTLLALGVHRWLTRSPGREAGGFTAEPLFEDRKSQEALGAVGAFSLTPEARIAQPEPGKFSGGGGGFGGAGSSSTF